MHMTLCAKSTSYEIFVIIRTLFNKSCLQGCLQQQWFPHNKSKLGTLWYSWAFNPIKASSSSHFTVVYQIGPMSIQILFEGNTELEDTLIQFIEYLLSSLSTSISMSTSSMLAAVCTALSVAIVSSLMLKFLSLSRKESSRMVTLAHWVSPVDCPETNVSTGGSGPKKSTPSKCIIIRW